MNVEVSKNIQINFLMRKYWSKSLRNLYFILHICILVFYLTRINPQEDFILFLFQHAVSIRLFRWVCQVLIYIYLN